MNEVWGIDMEDERVNLVKGIIAEKLAIAEPATENICFHIQLCVEKYLIVIP